MSDQPPLRLRRAEIRDVRDIRVIDRESYPTPWSEGWTIAQVTDPARVHLVAERDFVVIGHGGLIFLGDQAHVATLAVTPRARRQGVADALMVELKVRANKVGYGEVTLEVRASNVAAIALYERHGMSVLGRRKGYYADTGEDALIMTGPSANPTGSDPSNAHGV